MFRKVSAPRLIILGFAGFILLGAALLKLPASTTDGIGWLDALFESASAVTVTGLQVVTPATDFTVFGQAVLVLLMQVGGVGIMSASTIAVLLVGRRLGYSQLLIARQELNSFDTPRNLLRLLGQVAALTVAIELAGALVLFARFVAEGRGAEEAAGLGIFHAVSAFCNAGFDIFEQGTAQYAADPTVNLVFVFLIILGGLGFPVLVNLASYPRSRHLTLNSRVVLIPSGVLIVVGVISVAVFEWSNPATLGGEPVGTRLWEALFQGVTPRTAGFATVDYTQLTEATIWVQLVLMFIGVAPVSTGGGIKVTTVALVFLIFLAQARGEESVTAFRRRVPQDLIAKSLAVSALAALLVFFGTLALIVSDGLSPLRASFEVISAFGTVGLSLGVTPELGTFGKLLIIGVMFAGRVGPITLVLALSQRSRPRRYSYPEEEIAIG